MSSRPIPPAAASPPTAARAERDLALGYAPKDLRAPLAALFTLDARLGDILRTTREPMVGQMRLTWWYEALAGLDDAPAPAEPVLAALAAEVLPRGIDGASLAAMIDGWEVLLDGPVTDEAALTLHAGGRGGRLFALAGRLLGSGDMPPVVVAGEGWALADLAANLSDPATVARARTMAGGRLERALAARWERPVRPLGALALLARMDLDARRAPGHPRRLARLIWHRTTGG